MKILDKVQSLAIFKNVKHNYATIQDNIFDDYEDYVRLSEYVKVSFTLLNTVETNAKEVEILEARKKEVMANTQVTLNKLDEKIGELLALPEP